jgi:hypothetical protein
MTTIFCVTAALVVCRLFETLARKLGYEKVSEEKKDVVRRPSGLIVSIPNQGIQLIAVANNLSRVQGEFAIRHNT